MNQQTVSDPTRRSSNLPQVPGADVQAELEAAMLNLGAERRDLDVLLRPLLGKARSRQHVYRLLKQAWRRLQELRSNLDTADFDQTGIAEAITDSRAALAPGAFLSLEKADMALKRGHEASASAGSSASVQASLLGLRAEVALLEQDYQTAVALQEAAAKVSGLNETLRWRFGLAKARTCTLIGEEFEDEASLDTAISMLSEDVLKTAEKSDDAQLEATTLDALGSAYAIAGLRKRGTSDLEYAIRSFRSSLEKRDRNTAPLAWAETWNNLGNALGALAHRQKDEEMLDRCVEAFEQALEERTVAAAGLDRATTLNNLAAVLQSIGQRNKDTKTIDRAVTSYKEILTVWTKERVPLDWAMTMNNLGTALRLLGELRKGPRTLEQSVAAFQSALSVRDRNHLPQDWAMTQNNLGAALQKLAEREENPDTLLAAIDAYECALEEWTRDAVPMAWAMTQANLAVARTRFAEVTESKEAAEQAVDELEKVCEVFRDLSHAHYSELSIDQLGKTRKLAKSLAG